MNRKVTLSIIAVVLTSTLLACQFSSLVPTVTPAPTPTMSAPLPTAQAVDLTNQQEKLVAVYQAVSQGVVIVQVSNGLGSGWVYSTDGYVVTNAHVVGTEKKVEVDFPNGNKVYGNVVGVDQNSDLAVIKVSVSADQLHPLSLGDSDTLKVGQIVAAIGDPLALDGTTMTSGIIAGLGRSEYSNTQVSGGGIYVAGDFIETDAKLNPGNSGGPLLDLNGQVIGVNRSIQTDPNSGTPSGLGYAISVNVVKRVIPQLIKTGKFDYPYMGLSFLPDTVTPNGGLTLELIDLLGLKSTYGAYIVGVTPGSPADKAGLRAGTTPTSIQGLDSGGDLVIAVDGQTVQGLNDLMHYIVVNKSPGDTITMTIIRGSQKLDVPLTLGTRQ
jgi:S1-C subfamily serine protease